MGQFQMPNAKIKKQKKNAWDDPSHETSCLVSLPLAYFSELAHKLTTAGCKGRTKRPFHAPFIIAVSIVFFSPAWLPPTMGYFISVMCCKAIRMRGFGAKFVPMSRDKGKKTLERSFTERYYVIAKWIALCMPGQCHWGSTAPRTAPL